ncbi:hypothetical protein ACFFRR_005198 [Megaselia abdita]
MKRFFVILIFVLFSRNSYQENYVDGLIGDILFRTETRSLTVPIKSSHSKCQKQVPAIFFKTELNERIRGNGSTIHYMYVEGCCDGYKPYPYDSNRCVPDCKDNCRNGICSAPNKCECMDGFVANASNHCIETCPVGCPNGRCFLNGTSQCNRGYELDPTQRYCTAICNNSCGRNQVCMRPNECACLDGYLMTESGCQPVCSPDCGYGTCIAPNECKCLGNAIKKHRICHNFSDLRCENGVTESQYKCNCRVGYIYDSNTTSCLPDCGDECKFGVCISPGECRCYRNYKKKDTTCVPICDKYDLFKLHFNYF